MASQAQKDMLEKVKTKPGFIAALDQSGGSTPKALKLYGVSESEYANDDEMFAKVHEMRTRIITSNAFNGDRILGAILFENTFCCAKSQHDPNKATWLHVCCVFQ